MLGCVGISVVAPPWYESLTAGEIIMALVAVPVLFESLFAFLEELLYVRIRVD